MRKIKIGTRGSKLALWQAYHVEDLLKKSGLESEIVIIDTKGDQILDVSISKIGSKGVFTQELEDQLLDGRIDIAVHSAKDMQSNLPEGFEIIAFTEREKENDVLLSHKKGINLKDVSQPLVLGTSSTRRVATLKHFYPHVKTVEVRGNLQTRIRKMEEGLCDALLLAFAGVHRMGYDDQIVEELSLEEFTPAVGQGSVAIEVATILDSEIKNQLIQACNHQETSLKLRAERAYLRVLEGGCSIPVFALAQTEQDRLVLKGGIVSLDGAERITLEVKGSLENPESIGQELAEKVFAAGGKRILDQIKSTLNS
ncbi:MAG TPA: hydroxymethylbilane synthase [Algoriphagus sp.]|jgi:hydroxymethylbilane synthase|uniref:hydroxymethylbilane synthase n=2 Tax=Algoriphagus TaxID=246875 RepID=UPI000C378449|nr:MULTISPECIES: hydroxymethylbilane synthase [unclassified Algoriphagus]MAL12411.1 hydroxymethylbilane synthase [Algoriphagus sp.]MAN88280.1 hydroxymethylbilane synthase [Algoriphagus sp.]QYH39745.1 hydroxymethylbilane synthase [Algoriphagus sp. NBT04N3]HAH35288.1 hydroxymethylbilane synthase [Algoriphagus sp.]HAS58805.1 hydroxymethylbilane synthase [Algoriphagus sp.]|tara:strand:+ start:1997 stop:2932 length:936 start_codon:yes stop_codon:yes gene_type:complete